MESRAGNWIVAGLVLAALLLIAAMVAHGFRRQAAQSSAGAPVATAGARTERRKVPGLSMDEIRRAGRAEVSAEEPEYEERGDAEEDQPCDPPRGIAPGRQEP